MELLTKKTQTMSEMKHSLKQRVNERVQSLIDWSIPDEEIIGVQVSVMMQGYIDHYFNHDLLRYETIAVEQELVADLVNPKTGRASTIFDHCSKQDAFALDKQTGERVLIEHKSTSDSLDPASPYWRRLSIDSQVSKYILSARQNGDQDVRTCLYDVCHKPTTKPKQIKAADVRTIVEDRTYCGFGVPDDIWTEIDLDYQRNKGAKGGYTGKRSECLTLYGLRLRRLIADDPERFYGRLEVTRTDDEILDYSRQLWEVAAQIRRQRKSNVTPKNTTACYSYGTPCEFFSICCGEAAEQGQFKQATQVHSELDTQWPDGGVNVLTNSRVNTFLTCPEKHRLRYEQGLRKSDADEAHYLKWGSVFHEALEEVWNFYGLEKGDCNE